MPDPTDFGEKAFTAAQNAWRTGQEVAKREARILRLQAEISKLRSQREQTLRQMGEKVFDLFQRDLVKNQDLRMASQQVRSLDTDIEVRREEIEGLRKPGGRGEAGVEDEPARPPAEILDDDDEIIRG
jgi:hypothetical protein